VSLHLSRHLLKPLFVQHVFEITPILTQSSFYNFSKVWGEKYVTSNVQIINPATGQFEYIGKQYRYFTTDHGKIDCILGRSAMLIYVRAPDYGIWCSL
jgi:hypothetical protein